MKRLTVIIALCIIVTPVFPGGAMHQLGEYKLKNAGLFIHGNGRTLFDDNVRKELEFILYLISRDDYAESLFLLDRLQNADDHYSDSINYLTGWVYYRQKKLQASAEKLLLVRMGSPVYYKSHFFGAYNLAHTGDTQQAISVLRDLPAEFGSMHEAMVNFQLGGMCLLERDYGCFDLHAREFKGGFHIMAQQESRLVQHHDQLVNASPASPFLAGVLSAAVPGLGRIYAGKPAEGIVSFLYLAAFGFTSYDFYRGAGLRSPLFIFSATVTGVFYAGNIWGSVTAARRVNHEFHYEMDQRILFDLHIPLRNAFN